MLNIIKEKLNLSPDLKKKALKLIPIIKDIDNPENISNKFKLGIITSTIKMI